MRRPQLREKVADRRREIMTRVHSAVERDYPMQEIQRNMRVIEAEILRRLHSSSIPTEWKKKDPAIRYLENARSRIEDMTLAFQKALRSDVRKGFVVPESVKAIVRDQTLVHEHLDNILQKIYELRSRDNN